MDCVEYYLDEISVKELEIYRLDFFLFGVEYGMRCIEMEFEVN